MPLLGAILISSSSPLQDSPGPGTTPQHPACAVGTLPPRRAPVPALTGPLLVAATARGHGSACHLLSAPELRCWMTRQKRVRYLGHAERRGQGDGNSLAAPRLF